MRKKILSTIVTAGLVMSMLSACGGSGTSTASGSGSGSASSGSSDAPTLSTTATVTSTSESSGSTSSAASETTATTDASGKTFKVGIVQFMDHASLDQITESIEAELDAKAAETGATFDYKDYFFNGQGDDSVLSQAMSQLKDDSVDIVIPIATPTVLKAQSVFEDTDTPIVFSAVTDPVGANLVASMDAPGGHITGTSDALNTDTVMDLIFANDPDADNIGLLYSTSEDSSTKAIADAKAYLDKKGIKYDEKTGTNSDEVSMAADSLVADGVDAVFTPTDNTVMGAELAIYEKFTDAGIPHYAGADSFALNGAFLGFGISYKDLGTATADMAVDILVNGKDPATMPVQTLDSGIATINTDTAAALGYDLTKVEEAFKPLTTEIVETTTSEKFEN
ncbi:MAG: ABC transporter substrate-binding protein [Catonella sp.]|nr:ABC transporter substrate-binding protein [Catonella sp.]